MQAASREALGTATEWLDAAVADLAGERALALADELFAVVALLDREPTLRRALADPTSEEAARSGLATALLGERLSPPAMELLAAVVSSRWSRSADLIEALQALARQAAFAAAEKDGTLDSVEDELFRFGRILAAQPRLAGLLADRAAPLDGRTALLDELVGGKVSPVTTRLLTDAVSTAGVRGLERVVEELSVLAADRRDRYVAHVTAAAELTGEQEARLARSLARVYGRQIALQVSVDPTLLGGLVVRVGEEIIDGSTLHRLELARQRFSG
ncbi:F0F1 ATP synthase subunit delta [soil metagenome]